MAMFFWLIATGCADYVQDKVRPGTGREGALGYERYAAGAGMRTTAGMQEVRAHGRAKVEQCRSNCREYQG